MCISGLYLAQKQRNLTKKELYQQIIAKQSYLCIGLDTDLQRIPKHLLNYENPALEFNKQIIDATKDLCVAYKPNTAFYEAMGVKGWQVLESTRNYIPDTHFTIADAKRGDIGNTSRQYARAFFDHLSFDALTVAPYMGEDSIKPFLEHENKWVILLGLTSNQGSKDFQQQKLFDSSYLYERVLDQSAKWGTSDQLMFVIGATQSDYFSQLRTIIPDHFFLVPGIGAQGGNLQEVSNACFNKTVGLLVNSSRSIIYAGDGIDFAERARQAALKMQIEMQQLLEKRGLV